jgi:hypothetical protein
MHKYASSRLTSKAQKAGTARWERGTGNRKKLRTATTFPNSPRSRKTRWAEMQLLSRNCDVTLNQVP